MAVNNVQAVQPQIQQMSRTEHVIRTVTPTGSAAFDIGKALLNGKGIPEALNKAGENFGTVAERNHKAAKDAYNKTKQEYNDLPWYKYFGGVLVPVAKFVKNLVE